MTKDMMAAYLSEIFTSIEGEGLWVGTAAVFVRFAGCNLACSYCDTGYARERTGQAMVYSDAANGDAAPAAGKPADAGAPSPSNQAHAGIALANPVAVDQLVSLVKGRSAATLVLTGGEPLLQADFISAAAGYLHGLGFSIHLETNGTLPEALAEVRDSVDFVSMDVKLPSGQGGRDLAREHERFLEGLRGKPAAVKIVVTAETRREEVAAAARLVAGVNRWLPVFIQPAFEGTRPTVDAGWLAEARALAGRSLGDVRISLQMHKLLGVR